MLWGMPGSEKTPGGVRRIFKRDLFGSVVLCDRGDVPVVLRDTRQAARGLGWLARLLAGNEARALRRLEAFAEVPALNRWGGGVLERGYIDARPMYAAEPRDPRYFRRARRLLQRMHRAGVAHNDLAKEANWLVTEAGEPALIDFQMAWCSARRGRLFRLLAREDLRHLLKHKRSYCPQCLTPVERRLLARRSWLRELWFATGKPVYRWITRRLLGWRDNEGRANP
ncbi:serine/threonine protein kinase [Rehaibacterium terrae]|jgi:hypothetical protein|uniref:Serine/threonine protein kinase n=1 Tax=Rehaibacterium terrae TaxID=1341696 RepID=A0A7W8DFR3_9GAMM|nr:hypothetical protein [Rehaibacterium terrae]